MFEVEQFTYWPGQEMPIDRFVFNYEQLYRRGVDLFTMYNPCEIKEGRCINGDFCCSGCPYLSDKGCTVQALWCKLWLCGYRFTGVPRKFIDGLRQLRTEFRNLCFGWGGRDSLHDYVRNFYGPEKYAKWAKGESHER